MALQNTFTLPLFPFERTPRAPYVPLSLENHPEDGLDFLAGLFRLPLIPVKSGVPSTVNSPLLI
jgi:hypothetical protein